MLHCPTRKDRAHWVTIFELLIDLYKQGKTSKEMHPFDYDAQNKQRSQSQTTLSKPIVPLESANLESAKATGFHSRLPSSSIEVFKGAFRGKIFIQAQS